MRILARADTPGACSRDGIQGREHQPFGRDTRHRTEDLVKTFLITEWDGAGTFYSYFASPRDGRVGDILVNATRAPTSMAFQDS